ncbi:MAG TPA: nicotinate-nucleotide adenylyltransferase [Gemmataceae bacterium]|nr:nicotinate-nucleotide adenylyltransferase [Gemmataceae bacterium]
MRVGVFGGAFDPVHFGHLILAEQCREQGRLDEVLFVPTARPPHKPHPGARFDQRVEMLALAVAGNPAFRVDEIEKDREGPSYTVDTLAELRGRRPGDDLWLLVGGDVIRDLHLWYEPRRLLETAGLLVMARPGTPTPDPAELAARLDLPAVRLEVVAAPAIDIASHDLRRRAAEGRSLRYLLPRAVECYVRERRLYRDEA